MKTPFIVLVLGLLALASAAAMAAGAAAAPGVPRETDAAENIAFFEAKVRPLLITHCYECHGEKKQKGGLRLDSLPGWQQGGDSGAVIVPGKPDASLLIEAVRYKNEDLQMPPKEALGDEAVAVLADWIQRGAPDPRLNVPATGGATIG